MKLSGESLRTRKTFKLNHVVVLVLVQSNLKLSNVAGLFHTKCSGLVLLGALKTYSVAHRRQEKGQNVVIRRTSFQGLENTLIIGDNVVCYYKII